MSKFQLYLTEILRSPYKFQSEDDYDRDGSCHKGTFKTDKGNKIIVIIDIYQGEAEIDFYDDYRAESKGSFDLTGEGDSFRVMATVIKYINDTLTNLLEDGQNIQTVQFYADKSDQTGRASLYKKLVNKYVNKKLFSVKVNEEPQGVLFTLTVKNN